jgi:hypothetical protein
MKPVFFGGDWLDIDLPFLCEVHIGTIHRIPDKENFAVLILCTEPRPFRVANRIVIEHADKFDLIITHDEELLSLPNSQFCAYGTSRINKAISEKLFGASFLYSAGAGINLDGYQLRAWTWENQSLFSVDKTRWWTSVFQGRSPGTSNLNPYPYDSKSELFSTMFSIIIENTSERNYFTEKIMDAFRTYTVPIYYGCPNISDFFRSDGIIAVSNPEELHLALNALTPELYWNRLHAINENFHISTAYLNLFEKVREIILKTHTNFKS